MASRNRRTERASARALALLLDDGAEHVWIFAVERMTEMTTPLGVDAQEGGNQERGNVTCEDRLAERRHGGGEGAEVGGIAAELGNETRAPPDRHRRPFGVRLYAAPQGAKTCVFIGPKAAERGALQQLIN
jgi:hypothetical protein